jgi:hypothetical protein
VDKLPVQRGFEGGHGSHWDAVLEDAGELSRVVSGAYKRGTAEPAKRTMLEEGMAEVRFRALALGHKDFEARLIEFAIEGKEKPRVATVYPHLKEASAEVECRPTRIIEWGNGALEAQVGARLAHSGGEIAFFATDYFDERAAYRQSEPEGIVLTAIAYTCGTISPKERFEEVDGVKVDVSRASIVTPLKDSERAPYYDDDFFLQGPLASVSPFAYPPWGEGAIVRLELDGLGTVPVFARKKDFPHGWPKKGEFVAAYTWLQGRRRA